MTAAKKIEEEIDRVASLLGGDPDLILIDDAPLQALIDRWAVPPAEFIGHLPKAGTTLDYLGHADTTRALLEADLGWTWEPVAWNEHGEPLVVVRDKTARMWIRLTVCGVTRLGVGTCSADTFDVEKQLVGDALRNAAMRFGVALSLWSKSEWHDEPAGPPPAPPAPEGWGSIEEHDVWRHGVRERAKALPLDAQGEFANWWREQVRTQGWTWPLTGEQADVYSEQLAAVEAKVAAEGRVVTAADRIARLRATIDDADAELDDPDHLERILALCDDYERLAARCPLTDKETEAVRRELAYNDTVQMTVRGVLRRLLGEAQ